MDGKICMVTGASSGLGQATALELAKRGATVIMVCRSARRGEAARAAIRAQSDNSNVDLLVTDLSSQQAIRQMVEDFRSRYTRLDVLINNAGAMFMWRRLSIDGIERTWALNHLAPFLLTHLLLDRLEASAPARIVNIASAAAFHATIDFYNLQGEQHYSRRGAYRQSKLANVLFTLALTQRLSGSGVTANCIDPGNIRTKLGGPASRIRRTLRRIITPKRYAAQNYFTPSQAAEIVIRAACSPDLEQVSGRFLAAGSERMLPDAAHQDEVIQRLWAVSATLVGLDSE